MSDPQIDNLDLLNEGWKVREKELLAELQKRDAEIVKLNDGLDESERMEGEMGILLNAERARSEKLESLLRRHLERMKLINGPSDKCRYGENWGCCENHFLIHETVDFLAAHKKELEHD